jgi:hypothetical protein
MTSAATFLVHRAVREQRQPAHVADREDVLRARACAASTDESFASTHARVLAPIPPPFAWRPIATGAVENCGAGAFAGKCAQPVGSGSSFDAYRGAPRSAPRCGA